jgi:hypothetical protein
MTSKRQRLGGLAVLVAATAIGLAACGSSSSTPHVATLGNGSGTGGSNGSGKGGAPASGSGNPTQLLDEWAVCIRSHGAPGQADPTIDSNKDIEITMKNVSPTLASEVHGGTGPCSNYLTAASLALSDGQGPPTSSPAQDLKYAQCMQANGFPTYPDPNGSGKTNLSGIDTNSPAFENADKLCTEKVGQKYYPPGTEAPGVIIVTSCNVPAGGQLHTPLPGVTRQTVPPGAGPPPNCGNG